MFLEFDAEGTLVVEAAYKEDKLNGRYKAYHANGKRMLWANYRAASEVDGLPIDSYVLVNGSISYRFPVARGTTGEAFIRFFNLLDDDHREHPNGDAYGLILTFGLEFSW